MKKNVALLLALLMMLTMGMTAYAQPAENDVLEDQKIDPKDSDMIMPMRDCPHPKLVRITANALRYVSVSGSLHTKDKYFTARCSECMNYQMEIVDSQVVEPHTMVLAISACDSETKKHYYVYTCQGKCEYRDEFTTNCPGIHEGSGVESIETECPHERLERLTADNTRCEYGGPSNHLIEVYYAAQCAACDWMTEVVSRSYAEPHSWSITKSECRAWKGKHYYEETCGGCYRLDSYETICPGISSGSPELGSQSGRE